MKKYMEKMEKLLNVENDWNSEMDCPKVMGPCCLISEEEVAAAIKGLEIGKAAGPTGVVSEMMNASGVFVVCLPKPMEGMGRLQFSDIFTKLSVPPQAAGVVGTF